jgi:hypothetical protein
MQKLKNKQYEKQPLLKQPLLAGGCFILVKSPKENARPWSSGAFFGGAAGYCPPVQKVTDYSSTSLVCFMVLQPDRS